MPQHDDYRIPPAAIIDDSKIGAAVAEYARLQAERNADFSALRRLEEERARAVQADAQALADAIRGGKDDPGQESTRKADVAILERRRRAEALAIAVADAGRDLVATVDRQLASWTKKLDARAAEARTELAAAVEVVAAARDHLGEALGLAAWLNGFPERPRWPVTFLAQLPGTSRRNDEAHSFDGVLDAMRAVAAPPEPKPAPEVRPLRPVAEAS